MNSFYNFGKDEEFTADNRFFIVFAEYVSVSDAEHGGISLALLTDERKFLNFEQTVKELQKYVTHHLNAKNKTKIYVPEIINIKLLSILEISESDYLNWAGLA